MAKMGNFSPGDMQKLQKQLEALQKNTPQILENAAKELAARLYAKVKKRTPVDTGKLRGSWAIGEIKQVGDNYVIEITNYQPYASYVEYGHRTRNHKDYVPPVYMLTISVQELQQITPQVLERKIQKFLKEHMQ